VGSIYHYFIDSKRINRALFQDIARRQEFTQASLRSLTKISIGPKQESFPTQSRYGFPVVFRFESCVPPRRIRIIPANLELVITP